MSNPFAVNESVWFPSTWRSPLVRFNFDKIGAAYTTAILAIAMAVWLGFSYIFGEYSYTEWVLFLAISVWLAVLSLSIFPDFKTQKITLSVVFLPPILITFIINYIPWESVVYYVCIGLGLVVFVAYVYYWFVNIITEFKDESILIFISSISMFLTILSQIFLLIPNVIAEIIFGWFPFFPMAVLFWSSEPFTWIRLVGLFIIFLITFAYAVIRVAKEGAMFQYEYTELSKARIIDSSGLVAEIANSFIAVFNYTVVPIVEVSYFAVKVALIYVFSTIARFFEALVFKTLTHSLVVLYRFVRFLALPMAVAAFIAFLILFTTNGFFAYIHNPDFSNLVFLLSYFGAMVLVPFCFLLMYSIEVIFKTSREYYEIMVLPHVWIFLLLCVNTAVLVALNIDPYQFWVLSWVSIGLWAIGVVVFISNIRTERT